MNGWMGQILVVDLGAAEIKQVPTEPYVGDYVGGRGIAARIYWELSDPALTAFDPGNPLIFMTGPLVGTRVQAATVACAVAKSPAALPESYCYGGIAGYFAAELKKAGYDGLVVTGSASRPVYLSIADGDIDIRDAADLWGLGAYETGERLRAGHGKESQFVCIGVAGENLVRTATALASHESALSCGFGAVMGSKKLKAITVKGSGRVSVSDPEGLRELNRRTVHINERLHLAIPPDTTNTGRGDLLEVIGRGGCHACGAKCIRNVYRYDGRLEGLRHCQTMEYYLPWTYGRPEEPVETFFHAPTLANDYGIDTFELRSMVDWLYACYTQGALTEADTGLPLSQIGTLGFLDCLLHAVAHRVGFGAVLAEGMVRAADMVPDDARALMGPEVAPIGQYELRPPRMFIAHSLLYPLEPRVHQPLVHDIGMVHVAWMVEQMHAGTTNVTNEVVRRIAKAFWGSEEAGVMDGYEGKALAAKLIQDRVILKDSLGLCDFTWPITYSFATEDRVGDPGLEARLYSAVTGRAGGELGRRAETVANLLRAILIREGRVLPAADLLPEYNFTEPLGGRSMHGTLVPAAGDGVVDMAGNTLDRKSYGEMLREYYRLRGWDEFTGKPTAATLTSVGLPDAVTSIVGEDLC